jgi:PAS domain S-box-containing protein
MKATNTTNKQLIDELQSLKKRVFELETIERDSMQVQGTFNNRISRFFPLEEHLNDAIYVVFDRKYEFVNEKFSEIFGVKQEEVYNPDFDPMILVAPESRLFVKDQYREGHRSESMVQQYGYTGLTKGGSQIKCETCVLLIPYKWGTAFHGILRNIPVYNQFVDKEETFFQSIQQTSIRQLNLI